MSMSICAASVKRRVGRGLSCRVMDINPISFDSPIEEPM